MGHLEGVNEEVKGAPTQPASFPYEADIGCLMGAGLREQADEWEADRYHLSQQSMRWLSERVLLAGFESPENCRSCSCLAACLSDHK
jgi:hypothetical protein